MEDKYNLERFLEAQESSYDTALSEIINGYKESHSMWFIFPQIAGLGNSEMSKFYSISTLEEAEAYLHNAILGRRLLDICTVLTESDIADVKEIFDFPDYLKFQSCLTLFSMTENSHLIFEVLLKKYFNNRKDKNTLSIMGY